VIRATLLDEQEGEPVAWPEVEHWTRPPDGTGWTATVAPAVTWRRLESWIARRWPARAVTWIVEGPGAFVAPLGPFALATFERWHGDGWISETPTPAPLGWALEAAVYRVEGTAGDDTAPPPAVLEAHRRLHEYATGIANSYQSEAAIYASDTSRAPAGWAGKAIHLSGAADLLRPWRRIEP